MLNARLFNKVLANEGINFFTGVPCSLLGASMQDIEENHQYMGATIEGEALAVAAGAWLAGRTSAVFLQNSGLGNLVNTLTSLNTPFGIPALLVIGWRGMPDIQDEPQHETMGHITPALLDLMKIPHYTVPQTIDEAETLVSEAVNHMNETRTPVALLVKPDTFESASISRENESISPPDTKKQALNNNSISVSSLPTRFDVLSAFSTRVPENAAVIATTGKCGRELFTIKDRIQNLYMVGAMGAASAVGHGVAVNTDKPVIVLDGDGAALMRLGTFALIGREKAENLIHIVLDNAAHDSTGGQSTGSESIDFCGIARSCGYATQTQANSIDAFVALLSDALASKGPHFIHVPICAGSQTNLIRPTVLPYDVASRFSDFLRR